MKLSATCVLLGLLFLEVFDSAGGTFISFSRKWAHLAIGDALFTFCLLTPCRQCDLKSAKLASLYKKGKVTWWLVALRITRYLRTVALTTHLAEEIRWVRFNGDLWTLHCHALWVVYGASLRLGLIMASLIIYPTICWWSVIHSCCFKHVFFLLWLNLLFALKSDTAFICLWVKDLAYSTLGRVEPYEIFDTPTLLALG